MKITKIVFKILEDGASCRCYQDRKIIDLTKLSKENLEEVSGYLKVLANYIDSDIDKSFNSPCC